MNFPQFHEKNIYFFNLLLFQFLFFSCFQSIFFIHLFGFFLIVLFVRITQLTPLWEKKSEINFRPFSDIFPCNIIKWTNTVWKLQKFTKYFSIESKFFAFSHCAISTWLMLERNKWGPIWNYFHEMMIIALSCKNGNKWWVFEKKQWNKKYLGFYFVKRPDCQFLGWFRQSFPQPYPI